MIAFDKGPLQPFARIFAACPDYGELKRHFWYDWRPIFHRGRTNGSARVLCIASDPGATARIAARPLVWACTAPPWEGETAPARVNVEIGVGEGPLQPCARVVVGCRDYGELKRHFWYDWGPIFHRGRTNGSALVLCIASDPGATERIAARTLVGDAGQRVQGFLAKLGLTRSYLLLNAFSYALIPSQASQGDNVLSQPEQVAWRNRLLNLALTSETQAIVAFGVQARRAVDLWPGKGDTPVIEVPHPSSRDEGVLLERWRDAIVQLRALVMPDDDGDPGLPNYGSSFRESDYAPVPARDLPFGVPPFLGNDAWGRARHPPRRGSVTRRSEEHTPELQ